MQSTSYAAHFELQVGRENKMSRKKKEGRENKIPWEKIKKKESH